VKYKIYNSGNSLAVSSLLRNPRSRASRVQKMDYFLPLLIILAGGFFFTFYRKNFSIKDPVLLFFPYNFSPTISALTFYQVIEYTQSLDQMRADYKASSYENYLEWFYCHDECDKRQNEMQQFIYSHYQAFSNDYNRFTGLFLIFSPNFLEIKKKVYFPWHLLRALLVEQKILKEDFCGFLELDTKLDRNVTMGQSFKFAAISSRRIYWTFLDAILKLRVEKSPYTFLLIKETAKTFQKYAEVTGQENEVILWKCILKKLEKLPISASWVSKYSLIIENNTYLFEPGNTLMVKRSLNGFKFLYWLVSYGILGIGFLFYFLQFMNFI
jgi:hypothetical protein